MDFKDYYKIMGVGRNATQDEIKRAYRKLARKYHPDVSKLANAEARFKEVGEAHEVLKDPEKRAAYDQLGMNWKSGQEFRPPPGWNPGFDPGARTEQVDPEAFSDFFETLFGRNRRSGQGQQNRQPFHARGEDLHARVQIRIADAYQGAKRTVTLRGQELDLSGQMQMRDRSLNVQIPKGVKQGQKIRLAGQGAAGAGGGPAGDLYLEIEFEPHAYYRVFDKDIHLDLPVAPWEAALGAKIKLPTPAGPIEISIPANTSNGSKLRLRGRGIPGTPPGDFIVIPQVVLPPAATDKARETYRNMASQFDFNPRSNFGTGSDE